MTRIDRDARGFPVLLAEEEVVATSDAPSITDDQALPVSTPRPAGVDPSEWERRHDAIRDAAREFESYNSQDVMEWLKGKTSRDLSEAELKSFAADVRSHQLSDLVDILDHGERGATRGRRFVKLSAPRGYVRKTLNALTDVELKHVAERLKARGWKDKQIKSLQGKLPERRRTVLDNLGEIEIALHETLVGVPDVMTSDTVLGMAREFASHLPVPQVVVRMSMPPQIKTRLDVQRDARGLISGITPVEEADAG